MRLHNAAKCIQHMSMVKLPPKLRCQHCLVQKSGCIGHFLIRFCISDLKWKLGSAIAVPTFLFLLTSSSQTHTRQPDRLPPSHGSAVALYCPSGQSITAYAHTSHPHPILPASLTSTKRPASSQDKRRPSSISIITHALVKFRIFRTIDCSSVYLTKEF